MYFQKGESIFLSIGILQYFGALITNMIMKIIGKIIFKAPDSAKNSALTVTTQNQTAVSWNR